MATHARAGLSRLMHGSVAAKVVALATVPIFVVPTSAHSDGLAHGWVPTVLVPLDGTAFSERALPIAEEVARLLSAHLELLEAVPIPQYPAADLTGLGVASMVVDVGQMQAEAQEYLTSVAGRLLRGNAASAPIISAPVSQPAVAIANEARTRWAELVVMATHARSGLARLINGSVTEAVVRQADRPVLLIPPHFNATHPKSLATAPAAA